MVHAHGVPYTHFGIVRPLVIALLTLPIVAISAAILIGLLGIFIVWLVIVAALVSAIVGSDLVRHSMRRLAGPANAVLPRQAAGYPGR